MADVIQLSDRLSQIQRRPKTEPVTAEIMLFTGVRYERRDTTTPTDMRPLTGGAKKR